LSLPGERRGALVLRPPYFLTETYTMSQRATSWSVTINNPTPSDEEYIALARQKGYKVEGQLEKGANGTPHYQLLVRTPQVRFTAMKKAFPRAHIEIARNAAALQEYVHKEDTAIGQLPQSSDQFPSLAKFWDLVFAELTALNLDPKQVGGYSEKNALTYLDQATDVLIRKGYHVETLCVNPQTRSAFAKFAGAIFFRSQVRRQTDRQTAEIVVPTIDIPNVEEASDSEEESGWSSSSGSDGSSSPF